MVGTESIGSILGLLLAGLLGGAGLVALLTQIRIAQLGERLQASERERESLRERLQIEREHAERERASTTELQQRLTGLFATVSSEALERNAKTFLDLARGQLATMTEAAKSDLSLRQQAIGETLKPVTVQMERLEKHVAGLQEERQRGDGELRTHLRTLAEAQQRLVEANGSLREETARLTSSLRGSSTVGRWGELQLRNVVELAGMSSFCDFTEQQTLRNLEEESIQRPDLIVRLPGGGTVVIDAKVSLGAYLTATEASSDEERRRHLANHAKAIRQHCSTLSSKAYWQHFSDTPDFVVLFIPGEMFYSAALQQDPELLKWSWERKVVLATPSMLIALLRTISHGWQSAAREQNAQRIGEAGIDLYQAVRKVITHFEKVGKSLDQAVDAYNNVVGSLERNMLPKARRLHEIGDINESMPEPLPSDRSIRPLVKAELRSALEEGQEGSAPVLERGII